MTLVILLFFILPCTGFSQCKQPFTADQFKIVEGVNNGTENYYQNLIIQDIALAEKKAFHEISLRFDYRINFVVDQCTPGQLEIRVLPVAIKCSPLFYYGYDISASVKPEKADLVFHLVHYNGIITDSLIFYNISTENDSNLYNSLASVIKDTSSTRSVSFYRAVFHYTKSSYERFRDRILQIDNYYAASMIADSAKSWIADGFLSENGNKADMILRQLELERITEYISPDKFNSVLLAGQPDLNGLTVKYKDLLRMNNRYLAIIDYNRFKSAALERNIPEMQLLTSYLNRFDYYHQLAYKSNFRFVNFIDGLAMPEFTNEGLLSIYQVLNQRENIAPQTLRFWCRLLVQGLIERGESFELIGNQLRALSYYKSAMVLSSLLNLHEYQSTAIQEFGRMKDSICSSYLEISRKSALTENPGMAAQYFSDAQDLFDGKDVINTKPTRLDEYEDWLFLTFENQVVKFIDLKNYKKALSYLNEIQAHCMSDGSYICPEDFHDWMRTVRGGLYLDLLKMSRSFLAKDEIQDAKRVYGHAIEMRQGEGYRIDKDVLEGELEVTFSQIHYNELYEEGVWYYDQEEFSSALYYFNKADFLEKSGVIQPKPELYIYRMSAVHEVMSKILSEGRVKVWANDFKGAGSILEMFRGMLTDYDIPESDSLSIQYNVLKVNIKLKECERVIGVFNEKMSQLETAKLKGEFILARKIVSDAVTYSMDHLNCRVNDAEAWYQKVLLEIPAQFQEMENKLNDLTYGPYSDYLNAFHDLKTYYYHHKLSEMGIVFIPLYDRVMQVQDSAFLTGMLDHYISLKDFEHAFILLEKLRDLGFPSRSLTNQQKSIAKFMAKHDAQDSAISEPWKSLSSYTGRDKWYKSFKWSYKLAWFKATNWKMKYWPFIWKK